MTRLFHSVWWLIRTVCFDTAWEDYADIHFAKGPIMLDSQEQLEVLNDFFAWSGGSLPSDPEEVIEYMLTSYALNYSEEAAREYLMTEILIS